MSESSPKALDYSMKRAPVQTDESCEDIVVSVDLWLDGVVPDVVVPADSGDDSGTENDWSSSRKNELEDVNNEKKSKVTGKVLAKITGNVVAKISGKDEANITFKFSKRGTGNDATVSESQTRRCGLCSFESCTRRLFNYHLRSVHSLMANGEAAARLECTECSYTCMFHSQLRKHRQRTHGKVVERLLCAPNRVEGGGGNQEFSSGMYGTPGPFACPECSRPLAKSSGLQKHLRKVHNWTVVYSCRRCSFSSGTNLAVTRHADLAHPGCDPRPFACAECGHRARTQTDLRRHSRTHTGERPHLCLQCGVRFSHGSNLKVHTSRMHKDVVIRQQ